MTALATTREVELADALTRVRERLAQAAEAAGRKGDEIELLPITKFFPATDVLILSHLGCAAFGESREQEAAAKFAECNSADPAPSIRWHMVGRIQRNKARSIAGWAYAAHSVDSAKVITALDRASSAALAEGERSDAAAGVHPDQPRRRRRTRRESTSDAPTWSTNCAHRRSPRAVWSSSA